MSSHCSVRSRCYRLKQLLFPGFMRAMSKRPNTFLLPRDLEIQIRRKVSATEHDRHWRDHHTRKPDIGIGIEVVILRDCELGFVDVVYHGEYIGHGQSKTAFELRNADGEYHGKVLKVSEAAEDMEPHVFKHASEYKLTTPILYNCTGKDGIKEYHCWITERAIPLNIFCRYPHADRKQCALAAFRCLLHAASRGLHLSDCHWFNFGVTLTDDATEHVVVIIDAGSRGINPQDLWPKAKVNERCVHKFWKACKKECAPYEEIQKKWQLEPTVESGVLMADEEWLKRSIVTNSAMPINQVRITQLATEQFRVQEAQHTSGFKIMEIVSRFAGENHWTPAFALTCYRASKNLGEELNDDQTSVLNELLSRVTRAAKDDKQLAEVMAFWQRVESYRQRKTWPEQNIGSRWYCFCYDEMWPLLTPEQKNRPNWKSYAENIIHKKSGWKFVAKAILQTGLPTLQSSHASADATEYVKALGHFANQFAKWLSRFARNLFEYTHSERYERDRERSDQALHRRHHR